MSKVHVQTTINGEATEFLCEPRQSLLEVLRETLGFTGTKEGCNDGNCGACSITLDGVSLTVARLDGRRVTVAVVPHTASCTTVMDVPLGGQVNVETDLIGKYVRRVLSRTAAGGSSGLTLEGLANAGFL